MRRTSPFSQKATPQYNTVKNGFFFWEKRYNTL